MADIVTGAVTGQVDQSQLHMDHADIRREGALNAADIRQEVAREACQVTDAVKTSGWANSDRTGTEADRLSNQATQYFISEQNFAAQNAAAVAALKASTDMQFQATQAAIQLAGEKQATAAALATAATQQLIVQEAVKGRELAERIDRENLRYALQRAENRAMRCEPVCFIQGHGCHGGRGNGNGNGND